MHRRSAPDLANNLVHRVIPNDAGLRDLNWLKYRIITRESANPHWLLNSRGEHLANNSFRLQASDHQAPISRLVRWHQHSDVPGEELRFHRVALNLNRKRLLVWTICCNSLLPIEGEFSKICAGSGLGPGADWNRPYSGERSELGKAFSCRDFRQLASHFRRQGL